jgi:lipopolysaccharide/colanic/teichoic acid biosynthesis glycosyltransferase
LAIREVEKEKLERLAGGQGRAEAGVLAAAGIPAAKRWLDVAGAALLLCLTLPLWPAIALAVKLEDGGPVFFRFRAVGQGGRPLAVLKFRTMVPGAAARLAQDPALWQAFRRQYKLEADPRVTRVGRRLRRWSLDELPQCLNVLRGEMSLVGPRPFAPYEAERFGPHLARRLEARPGMTGLWQVSGRHELSYEERVRLDMKYIETMRHWSPGLDLKILARTVPAVLRRRGAC